MDIDLFKLLESPALILLALIVFLMFTNKEHFSKIGRDPTSKIFTYTFYTILLLAIISFALPALSNAIGAYYATMLVFAMFALLVVSETIKKALIINERKLLPAIINKNDNIYNDNKSQLLLEFDEPKEDEIKIINKHNKNIDINKEINKLLFYKNAIINDSSEDWLKLINSLDDDETKEKIKIIDIALQRDAIKSNTTKYTDLLSKIGNTYLDDNNPLKAIEAFKSSLAINMPSISPLNLIYDSIALGKSYILIDKKQDAKAMFEKAHSFYKEIANNPNIEINPEDIQILNEALSKVSASSNS